MHPTKEINALFSLIDDPDEEVYASVSNRIIAYGKNIIPNLEHLWETNPNEHVQDRIELLIHRLHFQDLVTDITAWRNNPHNDLLFGALLLAKYQYPDIQVTPVMVDIEKIRRSLWLELNSFLTPLEQANIFTKILYHYFQFKGAAVTYDNPDAFLIHKVLQTRKGNAFSNAIVYLVLAELLDLPFKVVQIPRQFLLAYFSQPHQYQTSSTAQHSISFFVDAVNGQVYSHNDIEHYFKRLNITPTPSHYEPLNNQQIIHKVAEELSQCFNSPSLAYKKEELEQIAALLANPLR